MHSYGHLTGTGLAELYFLLQEESCTLYLVPPPTSAAPVREFRKIRPKLGFSTNIDFSLSFFWTAQRKYNNVNY